ADTRWHTAKKFLDQFAVYPLHILKPKVRANDAHAAVNVVAHAARRNHTPFARIRRCHAANREAITPMNVRHRQARLLNTRQRRYIRHLLGRLIASNLIDQVLIGVDYAVHAHARFVRLGNLPLAWTDLFEWSGVGLFDHVAISNLKSQVISGLKSQISNYLKSQISDIKNHLCLPTARRLLDAQGVICDCLQLVVRQMPRPIGLLTAALGAEPAVAIG